MSNSRKFLKMRRLVPLFALLVIFLTGCDGIFSRKAPVYSETSFLLDTVVSVYYYDTADEAAVRDALTLCGDYARTFSRTDPESELYRLNAADRLTVSDGLLTVLRAALDYSADTSGAFDPTMGGVSALYGFSSEAPGVPSAAALAEALRHVGYEHVRIDGSTVSIDDPDTVIDLGAIAKGYIADRMREALLARGVTSAIIDLGGNVLCVGAKPGGGDYRVGIRYPESGRSDSIVMLAIRDRSVVTSGVYERSFTQDGVTYHHLLDAATGESIRNGLRSVSVVGPESMRCDALSTALFALGLEAGLTRIEALEGYEALFITDDFALHGSSGFDALLAS